MYVEKTKGKKYRAIPLNKRAFEIIMELGEKLFTNLDKHSASHKFNDVMKRVKLTQFSLHSLRHTFATNLVSSGQDIMVVKELLGHSDIRTSMVYAKADTTSLRKAVDSLKN